MEKYFPKRQRVIDPISSQSQPEVQSNAINLNSNVQIESPNVNSNVVQPQVQSSTTFVRSSGEEVNLDELESDPSLRKKIYEFSPNIEKVRRAYIQRGPNQPRDHVFPKTKFGKIMRGFSKRWFDEFGSWLEYSIKDDAAYCLCCYLFSNQSYVEAMHGNVTFVSTGMRNWKKGKERLHEHVGTVGSNHNLCLKACDDLMNQKQHISTCLSTQSELMKQEYRVRLTTSFFALKYLLRQGLAFRGRDESEDSQNRGNFLELLSTFIEINPTLGDVILDNAPENNKMTSPTIQKDMICAAASLTTKSIMQDMRGKLFTLLVDESRDSSVKEQMAIVFRYVDDKGCIIERFIGMVHVSDTTALSLKAAIDSFLSKHGLSLASLRGQGYDGASNMSGEFNGLKTLILKENKCAFYVHCFAHQLQLTLVAVSKKNKRLLFFFEYIANLVNIVAASSKRRDLLRVKQFEEIFQGIENGELETGSGLNQESSLQRAGDTRWGSHFKSLCSVIILYSPVIAVLKCIKNDATFEEKRCQASNLKDRFQTFEFIFLLHMMKIILGVTNELSQALQRRDQDIVNAIDYVKVSKRRLQELRVNGWDNLLTIVSSFCEKHDIFIPNMNDPFEEYGRRRRYVDNENTNLRVFCHELFFGVIDNQMAELDNRFNVVNTELLLGMACLDPSNSFSSFDAQKLTSFARFYPYDFTPSDLLMLEDQLLNYIEDMKQPPFDNLKGIGELAQKMVEKKKHIGYPMVYKLVQLALLLPVSTATVERAFSAMKFVKNVLRNRMGDELMNNCLVTYIEQDIFDKIDKEEILQYFQNMKPRRMSL